MGINEFGSGQNLFQIVICRVSFIWLIKGIWKQSKSI